MKKVCINFMAILALAILIIGNGCKKEKEESQDTPAPTNAIPTEEAADLVASVLGKDNGGLAKIAESTVDVNNQQINQKDYPPCGDLIDVNINVSNPNPNAIRKYNFNYAYQLVYSCNTSNVPQSLNSDLTLGGSFDGPRYASSMDVTIAWEISGILQPVDPLVINGSVVIAAKASNKILNADYDYTVNMSMLNVEFNKTTGLFLGGTASITIAGSAPAGSFNYNGTVAFTSGNTITLTLNNVVFKINIYTGEIV